MKNNYIPYFGWTLGLGAAGAFYAYVFAPASWWELADRPVVLDCTMWNDIKKPISFTPNVGKVIYDGGEVLGAVSTAVVSFSFKNLNSESCEWTISRISGDGKSRCKDKDGKYSYNDFKCIVNAARAF